MARLVGSSADSNANKSASERIAACSATRASVSRSLDREASMASCARRKLACGQKMARPFRAVSPAALMRSTMRPLCGMGATQSVLWSAASRAPSSPARARHRHAGFPGWVRCIRHGPANRSMASDLSYPHRLKGTHFPEGPTSADGSHL